LNPCIVIPTYENPRTLAQVIADARGQLDDVIVVDDGSGPETQRILADAEGIALVTHPRNLGKGAALQTGLAEARARGFTHAVTMDSDGQHVAAEVPKLLEAARAEPRAIVLGQRDLAAAGAGPGSRIGRVNSNFWTWVVTGRRLADTQTGFRVYPLEPLADLDVRGRAYDFEVEVLVRAAWCDLPIVSVPTDVRYLPPGERVSHLRLRHYLQVAHLSARFVTQRICFPLPYLRLRCRRRFRAQPFLARWREALRECFVEPHASAGAIAGATALGLFWGLAPVWGFQILLTLLCAHLLGLPKRLAVVASHVSFPLLVPFLIYGSLVVGRLVLGLSPELERPTDLTVAPADLPAWALGSILLGSAAAIAGGAATFGLVSLARRRANAS
jgi:uncharacterized protein (DUF2062 family)